MAQPKRDRKELTPQQKELDNLEKRTSAMLDRRNQLNDQARNLRGERDLLNGKKKELFDRMDALRKERDAFNEQVKLHKTARNDYQAQAKELIARRRGTRKEGAIVKSAPLRARELQHEIRDLEYKQETSVLTSKEEEKVIKSIRLKRAELAKLRPEIEKAGRLKVDLTDVEKSIDAFFAKADEEHQFVVAAYKSSQQVHEQFVEVAKEVGTLVDEANAKHHEFIETRKKADEQHEKVLELRSKILEIKGASRAEREEARRLIREHQQAAREAVADPRKLEQHAESELERLKKGGRISIGG